MKWNIYCILDSVDRTKNNMKFSREINDLNEVKSQYKYLYDSVLNYSNLGFYSNCKIRK